MSDNNKITLGTISSWGLGSLFLLSGLVGIFTPNMMGFGIGCLVITVLLLPPIRQFIHKKTGKSLSTGLRVVAVLVVLILISLTLPEAELSGLNTVMAETTQEAVEATPTVVKEQKRSTGIPEHIKTDIIERCKTDANQYGSALVKACVDQDIKAYKALQKYDTQHSATIKRCKVDGLDFGWFVVKACIDQDIKAQRALDNY